MVSLNAFDLTQKARISTLLENLREKVKRFSVVDRQGQIVGEVRDLIVDANRQLSFVVSKAVARGKNRYFRLKSNLVHKIDSRIQCIVTNIDSSQIENLPEYPEHRERESTIITMDENLINQEFSTGNTTPVAALATDTNNIHSEIESGVPKNVELVKEEIIRLLEEKLVVDRGKRKIGEVIIRKEIETRMIQVPVRREKLIVEQVSPERKQLAEIDLGQEAISEFELTQEEKLDVASIDSGLSVTGEFISPKTASLLLNAIALERNHGCKKVRVTVVVEDEEHQQTYKEWFDRTSNSKQTHE